MQAFLGRECRAATDAFKLLPARRVPPLERLKRGFCAVEIASFAVVREVEFGGIKIGQELPLLHHIPRRVVVGVVERHQLISSAANGHGLWLRINGIRQTHNQTPAKVGGCMGNVTWNSV